MSERVEAKADGKLSETATRNATCKCPNLLCGCEHQDADRDPILEAALIAAGHTRLHGHRNEQMLAAIAAVTPLIRQQVAEEIAAGIAKAGDERSPCRHHRNEEKSDHDSTQYAAYLDAASIARRIGAEA